MPVHSDEYAFTRKNVDDSPDEPGVYVLLDAKKGVKYYGMSTNSIRGRLQRHLSGAEGSCTQTSAFYKREVTSAKQASIREAELLKAFKARTGHLPACNEMAS